jgi:hypothetical protein
MSQFRQKIEESRAELEAQRKVLDALAELKDEAAVRRVLSALNYIAKAEEMVPGIMARLVGKTPLAAQPDPRIVQSKENENPK